MALDFVAGCIGGCAGVLVGHPFDTVKVKIQTQNSTNPQYKGGIDCVKTILRNESVGGLFKGMLSPMAGVSLINALIFGVYGNVQRRLPDPNSTLAHFYAGTAAGLVQSFICSPVELIKTRMQVQKTNLFKTPLECLKHIYRTEGLRGVFRGLAITCLREGPGFGYYFAAYHFLTHTESKEPLSAVHILLAGGTAGAFSWFLAYPIDVVKSRIQVDGMAGPRVYKNSLDCLVKSLKAEGPRFLVRGMSLTVVRAFPVNAATWVAVTWTIRLVEENGEAQAPKISTVQSYRLEELMEHMFRLPKYHCYVVPVPSRHDHLYQHLLYYPP